MYEIPKSGLVVLTIINMFICLSSNAQQKIDPVLKNKLIALYTWKIKELKGKGYMMYSDFPYNLNDHHKSDQYISISADFPYHARRPSLITITLPDEVDSIDGLLLGFNDRPLSLSDFSLHNLKQIYQVPFTKHWYNNHTIMASVTKGIIKDTVQKKSIDLFKELMNYSDLYILFKDHQRIRKIYFPLSFFQNRYRESIGVLPAYSTGNPADTALTVEERLDRPVFEDGSKPGSWQIAGIGDPIRFKQFIKYLRWLVNHHEKEKLAQLITFPQKYVIPTCHDSADFVHNYDKIFDQDLKRIINNQKLDQIFRNYEGVMIGWAPCIWIRQIGNRFMITAICNSLEDKKMEKLNDRYKKNQHQ